jgi:3-mercaptopyruvate sulfurtransferase SseA
MTGGRSAVSAALLQRLGHEVIFLNGEFNAWAAKNKVESGRPQETAGV